MTDPSPAGDNLCEPVLARSDRNARFRAVYDREFAFVWATARYFGVPPGARDDVVQEVFVVAFRRLDQLHYQVSPRAWLYGVTRRVASHYHRGATRRDRRLAALTEVAPDGGDVPHARHEAAHALAHLLAQLPRATRTVWELTELLGMSGPEIAGELEIPLNTVYSRLRLARAQLHELARAPEVITAGVAALRREDTPPPAAASRTWALLVPMCGQKPFTAIAAAWTAARSGMATTLIVASATVLAAAAPPRPPPELPRITVHEDMSQETSHRPPAFAPITAASPQLARPQIRPPNPGDDLTAEVALLDRARAHLEAGDPSAAEQLLAAHAREFPRGALTDAREAAAVEILCLRGDHAGAERAARALVAALPDSVLARRFARFTCPDTTTTRAPTE